MYSKRKTAAALLLTVVMIAASALSVSAESSSYDGGCSYNGKKMVSSFDSRTIAKAVEDLQPGDDVSIEVTYTNDSAKKTDWYMENEVVKTLEKTAQAKKRVQGTGAAENGGYTYELIQYDRQGKKKVLFSNEEVGGEAKPGDMEGLEQATNALDEWFYIDTLKEGESGSVVLNVAFDGETEVNDYMDTDGELNLRFAVEESPKNGNPPPTPPGRTVKTGDQSRLIMWSAIALIGALLLLVLAFISRRLELRSAGAGKDSRRGSRRSKGGKA